MHTYLMSGAGREGRLGWQLARSFLRSGDRLVLAVHHALPRSLIDQFPAQVRTVSCDFARPEGMEALLDGAGAVDGIINAASEFLSVPFASTSASDLRRQLDIHVVSPFLLAQAYAARGGKGVIVHVLDASALRGSGSRAAYRLAKSALYEEIRILAPLLAPGIRINGVAPSLIVPSEGEEELAARMARPLGRLASVDEVYRAVRYLLESPSVTGETLFVDSSSSSR